MSGSGAQAQSTGLSVGCDIHFLEALVPEAFDKNCLHYGSALWLGSCEFGTTSTACSQACMENEMCNYFTWTPTLSSWDLVESRKTCDHYSSGHIMNMAGNEASLLYCFAAT